MSKKQMHRILIRGGIISPRELLEICREVAQSNIDFISLGSRQDILLLLHEDRYDELEQVFSNKIVKSSQANNSNISSSYVSADIFQSNSWLTGANYLYILESFDYIPKLKVNIVDPNQNLVPLFYGQVNAIASELEDYWYLYIRNPEWQEDEYYPVLIHSNDIAEITKAIESFWEESTSVLDLFDAVNDTLQTENRTFSNYVHHELEPFPYYEGMHRYGIDKFWLGLYWRNNKYNISFLQSIAELCLDNGIANLCITPWKSIIIKDIPKNSKLAWECLLGKRGVNVRHSQLEMNWHLPAGDEESLEFKKYIVNQLDNTDISTYGLTIGVFHQGQNPFTSIAIVKNSSDKNSINTYQVKHAQNFNPSLRYYQLFAQDVVMEAVPELLTELSQLYFDTLENTSSPVAPTANNILPTPELKVVHQCLSCMNIYDIEYGDLTQFISPGLPFSELPEDFKCSSCGTNKSDFKKIDFNVNTEILNKEQS